MARQKLKEIRQNKGLTQKEMSIMLGITQDAYSKIEQGIRNPGYEVTDKILKALKCKFDVLENQKEG